MAVAFCLLLMAGGGLATVMFGVAGAMYSCLLALCGRIIQAAFYENKRKEKRDG